MKGCSVDMRDCLNAAYSAPVRERELCGGSAWSRGAGVAVALAARVGIALDEQTLLRCAVRDLPARQCVLQREVEEVDKRRLSKAAARAFQVDDFFRRGAH
jgi:hypothetical protein